MGKERQGMYGIVVMIFFLLAGIVGTVSAAPVSDQLQLEVRLLEKINQMNLTNEQIDQILPILKQIDTTYDTTRTEINNLLNQEKELLLQRKTEEAKAVETQMRVIHEKAVLQVKQILLDLEMIFTSEQKAMLKRLAAGGQMSLPDTPKMNGGERRYAIIVGKYDPPTQGNAKPKEKDKNYLDVKDPRVKIEAPVEDLLPAEVVEILVEKKETQLAQLKKELVATQGTEKQKLEKNIADLTAQIEELQARADVLLKEKVDSRSLQQNPGMGRDRMIAQIEKAREWMNEHGMIKDRMMNGRMRQKQGGMGFCADFERSKMLKTLIQVLEEWRAAGQ